MLQTNKSSQAMESETIKKNEASPKSHTSRRNLFIKVCFAFLVMGAIFSACSKDPKEDEIKTCGFDSPAEYLKNPSVSSALNKTGVPIHPGNTPPDIAGTYLTSGEITDASGILSMMIGLPVRSDFVFFDQTTSNEIEFEERVSGMRAGGSGGFIGGAEERFTVYLESIQSGSEAGLPNGVSVTVVMIMSGTKASNGNITNVEGVTVYTDAASTNSSYNVSMLKGVWYKIEGEFLLRTGDNSSISALESTAINNTPFSLQKALQNIIN